jgi:ABC-2 type transport system ATP-binding protein
VIRCGRIVFHMTNSPTGPALEVDGLRRSYGKQVVLDGIDLRVPAGTIFSLLGPNGAGKTTMVQILSTLIRPDSGTARVYGHDVVRDADRVRAAIGVTGQFSAVDSFLTGEENLLLMADLNHLDRKEGRARAADLLARFDLTDAARKGSATYSGGMKRKLDLAMGLMGNPRVIFLDEPTTGLDPRSRREMWQIVRDLVATGVTIFLTTQYLDEADQLADRIALLDQGHIVADGTPAELKARVPGGHVELRFTDDEALIEAAMALNVNPDSAAEMVLRVPGATDVRSLKAVLDRLDAAAVEVDGLTVRTPDLDDVFFALTGRTANNAETEEKVTA